MAANSQDHPSRPKQSSTPPALHRIVVLFIALVIVGPFLYGYFTQSRDGLAPNHAPPRADKLVASTAALDFGEQPAQEAFTWTIPLTNATDRPLEVLDFELGCLCTEVSPNAFTIGAGKTKEVEVVVDLQPRDDEDLNKRVREFAATIKPMFKGGWPKQAEWQLTGRVVNPYHVEPAYLNYTASVIEGQPFPSEEILVTTTRELESLNVECDPPLGQVAVARRDGIDRMFVLTFSPNEDLHIGRHELTLRLQGVCEDGSKLPPGGVEVFAQIVPDVEVFPSVVHLGALTPGQTGKAHVVIRSRTGRRYELVNIECKENESIRINEESQSRGGDRYFELRCEAEELGMRVARVNFSVKSQADNKLHQILLVVCYSGIETVAEGVQDTPPAAENEAI